MSRQRPDLFSERPATSADYARLDPSYGRNRRIVTVLVLLAIVCGGLYAAFHHRAPPKPGDVPLVKAEGPFKQKPENPGGIDIPHQDVHVYNQLDGSNGSGGIEHLLPPPEAPKPMASTVSTETTASVMTPDAAPAMPNPSATPDASAHGVSATAAPPTQQQAPPPAAHPAEAVTAAGTEETKPATAPPAAPRQTAAHGSTMIQLASVNDKAAAQVTLDGLRERLKDALGPAELRLVRADLGSKGIYYRIQSQGMVEAQAVDICTAVKAQKQGCILVHP